MRSACFFLSIFLSLYSLAQTYEGDRAEIDRILSRAAQWSDHYVDGDVRAIAELYTTDGKIMPANAPILEGRNAIQERFQQPEGTSAIYHKTTAEEISVHGDIAYDIGYYEGKTTNADGTEGGFYGKYLIIWKKIDGQWFIYADIWNSAPREQ